jgi:hypothetical protein
LLIFDAQLEKVGVEVGDELNSCDEFPPETLIMRQKQVNACFTGACQVNGIRWRNSKLTSDLRVATGC